MASSKDYLEFILGQLCELNDISYRAMMGEFILYIFKIIESNNRTEKSKFALSSICTYRNFLCYRTSCYCNAK